MPTGPIQKLHMVILLQPDLEKAIQFYQQLGLKQIFQLKDKWAEFKLGEVKIGLCPTSQSQEGNRTGVVLEVQDLHKAYNELKDTITFLSEPKEAVHGIMVSFTDPAGNILDLYQPTPEKLVELVKKTAEGDDQKSSKDGSCGQKDGCCKQTGVC